MSDSVIGPNVSIGAGAQVRRVILRNTIIGAEAEVEDALIEDSLIGSQAVIRGRYHRLNIGDMSEVST